jgi:hypothetical protein
MTLRIPEPLRPWARAARRAEWRITYGGSGHLRWTAPDGAVVVTSSTPSCPAGTRAAISRLRKAGLKGRS